MVLKKVLYLSKIGISIIVNQKIKVKIREKPVKKKKTNIKIM